MRATAADIAQMTAGRVAVAPADAQRAATGVVWDSREADEGDLYVALPGERVDGHDFAGAAFAAGAACALVQRADAQMEAAARDHGAALVEVPDTFAAVTDLARAWRARLDATVVGITGSSGKTTTKELVAAVLASALPTVATKANQNNELGVPATLLRADAETCAVVVEMGMRGLGQIAELCAFAKPDWGLVTNVGTSHMELLGSRENIARAKAELYEALPEGGVAFLNAADPYAAWMGEHARLAERGVRVVRWCGDAGPAEGVRTDGMPFVFARDVAYDDAGCARFTLCADGFGEEDGCIPVALSVAGAHNVGNACAAAAVGLQAGIPLAQCAAALSAARSGAGRQNVIAAPGGFTVVDDCYNANPDSMRASLAAFSALRVPGRKVAVLGDMGELGAYSEEGHALVGALAAQAGLDELVCAGPLSRGMAAAARSAGLAHVRECADADEALDATCGALRPGDAVLVKASHAMRFDTIVKGLTS